MNSAAMNNNSNNNSNASMQLETKIHTVAASFRLKRDEAHRIHQLATERLRLATEEFDAVVKTVQTAQANLKAIQEKAGGSAAAKQERATLQSEVAHLTKEVHFQHTELVQKRNKLAEQRESIQKSAVQRAASLTKLRNLVQQCRVKVFEQHKNNPSGLMETHPHTPIMAAALADEWNEDREGRLQTRWPRVIRNQGTALESAADENRRVVLKLQRILKGYQQMERSSHNLNLAAAPATTTNDTSTAKKKQDHRQTGLAECNKVNNNGDDSTSPDFTMMDSTSPGDFAFSSEGLQQQQQQQGSNVGASSSNNAIGDSVDTATTNASIGSNTNEEAAMNASATGEQ